MPSVQSSPGKAAIDDDWVAKFSSSGSKVECCCRAGTLRSLFFGKLHTFQVAGVAKVEFWEDFICLFDSDGYWLAAVPQKSLVHLIRIAE